MTETTGEGAGWVWIGKIRWLFRGMLRDEQIAQASPTFLIIWEVISDRETFGYVPRACHQFHYVLGPAVIGPLLDCGRCHAWRRDDAEHTLRPVVRE
jgi:hypothetical protein